LIAWLNRKSYQRVGCPKPRLSSSEITLLTELKRDTPRHQGRAALSARDLVTRLQAGLTRRSQPLPFVD
jgi:hypothetical protein